MKILILSTLLVTFSCGKMDLKVGDSLGDFKSVEPLSLGDQQINLLNSVCSGIVQKTSALPLLINTNLTFSYSMKGCVDSAFSGPLDVPTTIQNINNSFRIVKSDSSAFYFSDLETTDSGTMSLICKQLTESANLQSPINLGVEYLFISTQGISSENCAPATNEVCIEVSKGTLDPSGLAKIHTKEWVRFSLDSTKGRKGFFTSKKQISSLACPEGKLSGHKALLK
jgi:hypothetical protein